MWLHKHGYPCDESTVYNAVINRRVDILQYASEHGCPWYPKAYQLALERNNQDVIAWIKHNRPPSELIEDSFSDYDSLDEL